MKVHHKQLKLWNEPPDYLKQYLRLSMDETNNHENKNDVSADCSTDSSETQYNAIIYSSHDSSSDDSNSGGINSNSSSNNSKKSKYFEKNRGNRSRSQYVESSHSSSCTDSDNEYDSSSSSSNSNEFDEASSATSLDIISEGKHTQSRSGSSQFKGKSMKESKKLSGRNSSPHSGKLKSKNVPLEILHCSEPSVSQNCICIKGELNGKIAGNRLLDWSFGSSDFNIEEGSIKFSSPMHSCLEAKSLEMEGISPIVLQELHVGRDKVDKSTNINQDDEFVQWIEQSLVVQEELVDRAVLEVEKVVMQASSDNNRVGEVDQVDKAQEGLIDESFYGFGEESSVGKYGSANREALRILKDHLKYVVNTVGEYRGANYFLRREWGRRYRCSESRLQISSQILAEASDIVRELPQINLTPGSQRVTRSRGAVESYPNVQQKTLEYRSRKQ